MKRREFINRSAIVGASLIFSSRTEKVFGMIASQNSRNVIQILNPHHTRVGTLPIIRLFPGGKKDYISPFVLFDEFGPVNIQPNEDPLRVNAHPHAGIVPTTYFISGSGHHKDSLNIDRQINEGEFMMFNSGRGAIHMEESGQLMYDEGGVYHGFQIWLNLPAAYKYVKPSTSIQNRDALPIIKTKEYTLKVVMGSYQGREACNDLYSPAFYYHVQTKAGARLNLEIDPTHNAFLYAIDGSLELKDQVKVKKNHMAMFERGKSQIDIFTEQPAEILLLGGKPLNDPVVSYGPFVMNTEEQIQQCINDYRAGRMGNPELVNQY